MQQEVSSKTKAPNALYVVDVGVLEMGKEAGQPDLGPT